MALSEPTREALKMMTFQFLDQLWLRLTQGGLSSSEASSEILAIVAEVQEEYRKTKP